MRDRTSPLPEPLRRMLFDLGNTMQAGRLNTADLHAVLAGLDALPPLQAAYAGQELRAWCQMNGSEPGIPLSSALPKTARSLDDLLRLGQEVFGRRRQHLLQMLRDVPDLAWLLLFHADGRWREFALDRIADPPCSPFRFIAVTLRLNDWVEQVRTAALDCAHRLFPSTSPAIIASAATMLLLRRRQWNRWRGEAAILDAALARPEVADSLAQHIGRGRTRPLARVLAEALRAGLLDRHLPALARTALQPAVRAMALRCLIEGRATWPDGYARQWTNKPLGLSRRVPVTGGRDMLRTEPLDILLRLGAADPSPAVRKIVASALIEHCSVASTMPEVVSGLAADKNRAVRERIAFLLSTSAGPKQP